MNQETINQIESLIRKNLQKIEELDLLDEQRRQKLLAETKSLIESLNEVVKTCEEYYDRSEKRRIDEEDRKASRKMRSDESKQKNKDRLIDIGWKIVVPIVTFVGGCIVYEKMQNQILHFEEFGKINSKPGRELRFPFPKFMR